MKRRRARVLFAGLFHETHCFLDETTSLKDFEIRRGAGLLACTGDASPLGGALEAATRAEWEVIPAADYRALPSGIVEDDVIDCYWTDFRHSWRADLDAVFFVLHGAMVSESCLDVEGEILKRLRSIPGAQTIPIVGVYDLHANFSTAMARHADALVAYRENPHVDARDAALRAVGLLHRHFETGVLPRIFHRSIPIIWAPLETETAVDPMRSLEGMARRIEATDPGVWAANIAAGFAYADTPSTGLSFQIIATDEARKVDDYLDQLTELAGRLHRAARNFPLPVEDIFPELRRPANGLTVIVEPSDNIGAGAPGDGTGCLRVLVEQQVENAAIAINDPDAVAVLQDLPEGKLQTLRIGGKGSRFDSGPVTLEVKLIRRSDGKFQLEDKQSHLASLSGDQFDMGSCAVVQCGGVLILLTSRKTPPFDLGQWRSQGIDPATLNFIVAKAAVAHKAAYDPIALRTIVVDTQGPCLSDLTTYRYKYATGSDRWGH